MKKISKMSMVLAAVFTINNTNVYASRVQTTPVLNETTIDYYETTSDFATTFNELNTTISGPVVETTYSMPVVETTSYFPDPYVFNPETGMYEPYTTTEGTTTSIINGFNRNINLTANLPKAGDYNSQYYQIIVPDELKDIVEVNNLYINGRFNQYSEFLPGEKYVVTFDIKLKNGEIFSENPSITLDEVNITNKYCYENTCSVRGEYTTPGNQINYIELPNIIDISTPLPKAGDYGNSIFYYNIPTNLQDSLKQNQISFSGRLSDYEKFLPGETYEVYAMIDAKDGYKFSENPTIKLDGVKEIQVNWDANYRLHITGKYTVPGTKTVNQEVPSNISLISNLPKIGDYRFRPFYFNIDDKLKDLVNPGTIYFDGNFGTNNTFLPNENYNVYFNLKAKDGYIFDANTLVNFNGVEITNINNVSDYLLSVYGLYKAENTTTTSEPTTTEPVKTTQHKPISTVPGNKTVPSSKPSTMPTTKPITYTPAPIYTTSETTVESTTTTFEYTTVSIDENGNKVLDAIDFSKIKVPKVGEVYDLNNITENEIYTVSNVQLDGKLGENGKILPNTEYKITFDFEVKQGYILSTSFYEVLGDFYSPRLMNKTQHGGNMTFSYLTPGGNKEDAITYVSKIDIKNVQAPVPGQKLPSSLTPTLEGVTFTKAYWVGETDNGIVKPNSKYYLYLDLVTRAGYDFGGMMKVTFDFEVKQPVPSKGSYDYMGLKAEYTTPNEVVTYEDRTITENISYEIINKEDNTIAYGRKLIEVKGENGIREYIYKDKYINGVLVGEELTSEKVLKEPVNEVVLIGTKRIEETTKTTESTTTTEVTTTSIEKSTLNLDDISTGISVNEKTSDFSKNISLKVALLEKSENVHSYDIYFVDDKNNKVQPSSSIMVSIPYGNLDPNTLRVIHVLHDGTEENIKYIINGENVVFAAKSFSIYKLVGSSIEVSETTANNDEKVESTTKTVCDKTTVESTTTTEVKTTTESTTTTVGTTTTNTNQSNNTTNFKGGLPNTGSNFNTFVVFIGLLTIGAATIFVRKKEERK